jgi:hypothetical protein
MTTRALDKLIKATCREEINNVHTTLIGQVISYDGATNTCSVQPVNNIIRVNDPNNLTTIGLPQIDDVPVKQFGSGKLLFSVAPQVGSYGEISVSEMSIENWLINGGIDDPGRPYRFDISDAIFSPGLYPTAEDGDNGLIAEAIKTDRIELRTRSALTSVAIKDDETVEVKNEKAVITIDSSGAVTITSDDLITTSGTETVIQNGTDFAVQFTAMQSAFDTLKSEVNSLVTLFTAHTHPYFDTPVGASVTSVTTTPGVPPVASMSGAKVSDVRLP